MHGVCQMEITVVFQCIRMRLAQSATQILPTDSVKVGSRLIHTEQPIYAVLHKLHYVLDTGREAAGWDRAVPMPTSRHGLGLQAFGGALYAAGGCSEEPQRDLPTLEVYRPSPPG